METRSERVLRFAPWVKYYALTDEQRELLNSAGRSLNKLSETLESDPKSRHQIVHLTIVGMIATLKSIKAYCREEIGVN